MLKYLPKTVLTQWVVGSLAAVGAASAAFVLVFPSQDAPELPNPDATHTATVPPDAPAPDRIRRRYSPRPLTRRAPPPRISTWCA